jgi:hypothetical protein
LVDFSLHKYLAHVISCGSSMSMWEVIQAFLSSHELCPKVQIGILVSG